jgi:hypothetical protein
MLFYVKTGDLKINVKYVPYFLEAFIAYEVVQKVTALK